VFPRRDVCNITRTFSRIPPSKFSRFFPSFVSFPFLFCHCTNFAVTPSEIFVVVSSERMSAERKSVTSNQIVHLIDENRFAKIHTVFFHFLSGGTTALCLFVVQKSRELTRIVYFYVYACETYATRTRSAIKLRVWKVSRWKIVKKSARALTLACVRVCSYAFHCACACFAICALFASRDRTVHNIIHLDR